MANPPVTSLDLHQATPQELVVMLIDAGLTVLDRAWQASDAGDGEEQHRQMALAARILAELEDAVEDTSEIGAGLKNIFRSLKLRLMDREANAITDGILLLRPVRQLWEPEAGAGQDGPAAA